MGTDLQLVFDSFFIKVPSEDFKGKESQVFQFFKTAIAKCRKHLYDEITYEYDENLHEGYFKCLVSDQSIELISMYMAKEYFTQKYALISGRKQYLGTQAFYKIPVYKEQFEVAKQSADNWTNEIERFLMEFPEYSDER